MKRKTNFLPAFLVTAFLSILILSLSLSGNFQFLSSFLEKGTSAVQGITFGVFQKMPFISESAKIKKLEEKNLELLSYIADFEKLKKENAALSDQFQTSYPRNTKLLKADVIGAPGFVPGISQPISLILNKGSKDDVKVGLAVVIKNNLVGTITDVSVNLSKVNIINNSSSSFTAKTENGALGVVRGTGESLTLNNVQLLENLKAQEIVLTYGDINLDGVGIPADLVIGQITEIEKNPSNLFQKAKLQSHVDFAKLSTVFIYLETK